MTIRFRALAAWPPVTGSSRTGMRLSGKPTYPEIIKRFETEMEALKAQDVWIESGHDADERRLDGHIKTNAKPPKFPGVIVRLYAAVAHGIPSENRKPVGALWFHCNTYADWQENLWAIAMTMERVRGIATYGTIPENEIYALFADTTPDASKPGEEPSASGPNRPRPTRAKSSTTSGKTGTGTAGRASATTGTPPWNPTKQDAARFLLREAGEDDHFRFAMALLKNPAEAKRVFIVAAKNAHPDIGGTDTRMRAVNEAWEALNT